MSAPSGRTFLHYARPIADLPGPPLQDQGQSASQRRRVGNDPEHLDLRETDVTQAGITGLNFPRLPRCDARCNFPRLRCDHPGQRRRD